MQTKSILGILVAALAIATFSVPTAGYAAGFVFDIAGEGEGEFNFEVTESNSFTFESGSLYNFNGGAGSEGNAWSNGGFSAVYGSFDENAGGWGNALSDTLGNNYANAGFSSASYAENGGYAADLALGLSSVDFSGLTVAGGAGSANTGLTWTNTYTQGWGASFDYSVDADGAGFYGFAP